MSTKLAIQSAIAEELQIKYAPDPYIVEWGKEYKREEPLFYFETDSGKIPILGRGGLFTLTGKAKSRKSFLVSYIIGATCHNLPLIKKVNPLKVLYIDTEQRKYEVSRMQSAIRDLGGASKDIDNIDCYALRGAKRGEKLSIIKEKALRGDYDLLAIDNIRDLVYDINSQDECNKTLDELVNITTEKNTAILTVIHQNKGDSNARGHLGSELIQKSETVWSVEKSTKIPGCSEIKAEYSRDMDIPDLLLTIDPNRLPLITILGGSQGADKPGGKHPTDHTIEFHRGILTQVFGNAEGFLYNDLVSIIKNCLERAGIRVGTSRAKDFLTHYVALNLIKKPESSRSRNSFYTKAF